MSENKDKQDKLPQQASRQIDELRDEFEAELASGATPSLKSYLPRVEARYQRRLLEELVAITYENLRANGVQDCGTRIREDNPDLESELNAILIDGAPTVDFERPRQTLTCDLAIGSLLGSYRIVRLLGSGGMGAVYEAEEIPDGRRVAVKVIKDSHPCERLKRRFLREGRLAASVNHPNSVYVYGCEEIDGQFIIVMELATGGTLATSVIESGLMLSTEAVDSVLDVVAGLEAAYTNGVLHRDVKPSNCFLGMTGEVKVGDYGLSVSNIVDIRTLLTEDGGAPGCTPQFASPEQLRGEELDVRSDIYSVGATLYYLIAGHPPFNAKNLTALVAQVVEAPAPKLPKACRAPKELDKVLSRCLAKDPGDRYQSYEELRVALEHFSTQAGTPAKLGERFLAGTVDFLLLLLLDRYFTLSATFLLAAHVIGFSTYELLARSADLQPENVVQAVAFSWWYLLGLAYFTLCEWRYGASLGKWIFKLRVADKDGGKPLLARAFGRTTVFVLLADSFGAEFLISLSPSSLWDSYRTSVLGGMFVWGLSFFACFCTVRSSNGWRGVHEFLSVTRVLRRSRKARREIDLEYTPQSQSDAVRSVGPYDLVGTVLTLNDVQVEIGHDPILLRTVWVVEREPGTPPLPVWRQQLSRPGRLRWLSGVRNTGEAWDAFEALPGYGLVEGATAKTWSDARGALRELCEELDESVTSQQLPNPLSVERVWIGDHGRVVLLDFDMGVDCAEAEATEENDLARARGFLWRVTRTSLVTEGQTAKPEDGPLSEAGNHSCSQSGLEDEEQLLPIDMPFGVRRELLQLRLGGGSPLPTQKLVAASSTPAKVTFRGRLRVFLVCLLLISPLLFAFYLSDFVGGMASVSLLDDHPEVVELAGWIDYYQSIRSTPTTDDEQIALQAKIAASIIQARYLEIWKDPGVARHPGIHWFIDEKDRSDIEKVMREPQRIGRPTNIDEAKALVLPTIQGAADLTWSPDDYKQSWTKDAWSPRHSIASFARGLNAVTAILAILSIPPTLFLGCSPLLSALGVGIVTRKGKRASRARASIRAVVFWGIVFGCFVALTLVAESGVALSAFFASAIVVLGFVSWMFLARRGPHDLICGTLLVPH